MRNFSRSLFAIALFALGATRARAQTPYQGFAVERFYPSAPGGGWLVMDTLDMHGGLGGTLAFSAGYEKNPLRIANGSGQLAVISDAATADFAAAITYDRFRLYLNLDLPLAVSGQSGIANGYAITSPSVDISSHPDTLSDARLGFDVRLFGKHDGRFRFGAGAQLFFPNGKREEYNTDDTFRGMLRFLVAGDVGRFAYAAQLGVHIRPVDDAPVPEAPRGSELLFGAAGGAKFPLGKKRDKVIIIGPEIYGATALRSFFGASTTAIEALASARFEGTRDDVMQVRIKLGAGGGLNEQFGAPEWRLIFGIEVFNHAARRRSQ